ncbi:HipA family kinase [Pseudocnuella soli]|uniref:HipA family kinase n=1 Tax=Pseudocnuella soli TaxID=2502779 RepID=UPI00104D55EC|nr:HipA family kinase [Pseudocnuella soli]
MESGTTQPLKVMGVDRNSGDRGEYVVKCRNANRMSARSSCRELLGAWMAAEIGIRAVAPVLVHLSPPFVQTFAGKAGYTAAAQSIGFNFGTVYQAGYQLVPNQHFVMANTLMDQAAHIFIFDMFIGNADRGAGKPNVLSNGKNMLVFDHELAFSYLDLLSFARNPRPWELGPMEQELYKQHYFYPLLKGSGVTLEQHKEGFDRLNDGFWQCVHKYVPQDWHSEDLDAIRRHTDSILEHKDEFFQHLTQIVAS